MKRGYVYQRDTCWAAAIPDSNNRGGYKIKSGFSTMSKAKDYLNCRKEQIENVQAGLATAGVVPYKEYFKEYLQYILNNFSKETHKTYKGVLKNFLMFMESKYPQLQRLADLKLKVFEDYKTWHKDTKHKDNTVNNHIKALKSMMNVAIKWEYLDKNPVKGISSVSVEDEKPIVTLNTPDRFNLFFERCGKQKPSYYAHFYCSVKLGLRFGEMATLEWENIDFEHNVVQITRKETFNPKGRGKKDKKPKERVIPMSKDVADLLMTLPRTHKKVFLKNEKPISRKDKSFRRWIIAIVRGTELEGMTRFHELRHSAGDILGQTHGIYDIKAFLGHTDIRTTERYVRIADEAKKRMAETLGKFGDNSAATIQKTIQETK